MMATSSRLDLGSITMSISGFVRILTIFRAPTVDISATIFVTNTITTKGTRLSTTGTSRPCAVAVMRRAVLRGENDDGENIHRVV